MIGFFIILFHFHLNIEDVSQTYSIMIPLFNLPYSIFYPFNCKFTNILFVIIYLVCVCVCVCVWLSHVLLCNPMAWRLPGSSAHGILQATKLEWVAISFFKGSFQPIEQTWVSFTAGKFFTVWAPREAYILSTKVRYPVNIIFSEPKVVDTT